jgi:type I restriction enzyme, S subunit
MDLSDTKFISPEAHTLLTRNYRPSKEDILYTKVGTTGIAKVIDIDIEFSIFVSLALLKIKHAVIFNRYLEYFLNSPFAREQAQKRTRGMANKNLVISDIKEIEIHFPKSIPEQHSIVAKLDALSVETKKLGAIYQQKLAVLEELRKSILQKAFNGELSGE